MKKAFLIALALILIPQMAGAVQAGKRSAGKKAAKSQTAMESLMEEAKGALPGEPCKTSIAKCGEDLACMYWMSVAQEACAKR